MPLSTWCLFLSLLLLLSISVSADSSSSDNDHSSRILLAKRRKWRSAERERFVEEDLIVEEEEEEEEKQQLNLAATQKTPREEEEEEEEEDPLPPVWPEVFHASIVQFRNGTSSMVDLYYDWKKGRNANLIRRQLDGEDSVLFDLEYQNRTSFYFDRSKGPEEGGSCRRVAFPVGILSPDWLSGARYLGARVINGFECHGWAKGEGRPATEDFVHYFARTSDGVPVRWTFHVGEPMDMNVYSFEVGKEMPEEEWQAPSWCF